MPKEGLFYSGIVKTASKEFPKSKSDVQMLLGMCKIHPKPLSGQRTAEVLDGGQWGVCMRTHQTSSIQQHQGPDQQQSLSGIL